MAQNIIRMWFSHLIKHVPSATILPPNHSHRLISRKNKSIPITFCKKSIRLWRGHPKMCGIYTSPLFQENQFVLTWKSQLTISQWKSSALVWPFSCSFAVSVQHRTMKNVRELVQAIQFIRCRLQKRGQHFMEIKNVLLSMIPMWVERVLCDIFHRPYFYQKPLENIHHDIRVRRELTMSRFIRFSSVQSVASSTLTTNRIASLPNTLDFTQTKYMLTWNHKLVMESTQKLNFTINMDAREK